MCMCINNYMLDVKVGAKAPTCTRSFRCLFPAFLLKLDPTAFKLPLTLPVIKKVNPAGFLGSDA